MERAQRRGDTLIGEPPRDARRRAVIGAAAHGLDQQHFEEAFEHEVARGPIGARLVSEELRQQGKTRLVAHDHQPRQQRDQERGIGGREAAMADPHPHRRGSVGRPDMELAGEALGRRCHHAGSGGFEALVHQGAHGGDQDEIPGLHQLGRMVVDRDPAGPFEDRAIEGLAIAHAVDAPGAGAFDQLREPGRRVEQRDDLGKRVDRQEQDFR